MKYYTLEYDMNRPYNRQITMPLLSRQGVAVAVLKDGRRLDLVSGDVEVQGAEAGPEHGGYLTFELSSGAEPGLYEKTVSLHTKDSVSGQFKLQVQAEDLGWFEADFEAEVEEAE